MRDKINLIGMFNWVEKQKYTTTKYKKMSVTVKILDKFEKQNI